MTCSWNKKQLNWCFSLLFVWTCKGFGLLSRKVYKVKCSNECLKWNVHLLFISPLKSASVNPILFRFNIQIIFYFLPADGTKDPPKPVQQSSREARCKQQRGTQSRLITASPAWEREQHQTRDAQLLYGKDNEKISKRQAMFDGLLPNLDKCSFCMLPLPLGD